MQTISELQTTFVHTCPKCQRHIHSSDRLDKCSICDHTHLHLSAQGSLTDMQQWLYSLLLGLDNEFKGI